MSTWAENNPELYRLNVQGAQDLFSYVKTPVAERTPEQVEYFATHPTGDSNRFKIGRAIALGIIGVATGGAALTAAGVIGGGAAAAAAPAVGAGTAGQVAALTSGYEYLGAAGASTLSSGAAGVTWAGIGAPVLKAAGMVGSVAVDKLSAAAAAGISKLLHPNAGMTVEAAAPAYADQIAAARQLSTPTLIAAAVAVLAVIAILAHA